MKHLFTEKYIRALENNKKNRLEIYDSFCPYLGCRIGKNGQKTYFVRKKYLGRNIRVTIGKTDEVGLEFARKKAFSLLEKIQNGINPNEEKYELSKEISLGIFYEEYMERHVIAKTSKRNVDNSSGIYRRHLTQWKNKRLSELNMRMIELHFNSVKKTHGIFAANQMLTMLRHMYNKAIQWGWDGRNPTTGIKKFHVEPRDRFLAPDEIQRLFAAFVLSVRTGKRSIASTAPFLNVSVPLISVLFASVSSMTGMLCGVPCAMFIRIKAFPTVFGGFDQPIPVPNAVTIVPISAELSILSKRARSTFKILPRPCRGSRLRCARFFHVTI